MIDNFKAKVEKYQERLRSFFSPRSKEGSESTTIASRNTFIHPEGPPESSNSATVDNVLPFNYSITSPPHAVNQIDLESPMPKAKTLKSNKKSKKHKDGHRRKTLTLHEDYVLPRQRSSFRAHEKSEISKVPTMRQSLTPSMRASIIISDL